MIYAGIGARATPKDILEVMKGLGVSMANAGAVLRSGGANGADSAFESGCDSVHGPKEIFLPWPEFNWSQVRYRPIPIDAFHKASLYHPFWSGCSGGVKRLHARNALIILGYDLKSPVDFVLCWTPGGHAVGGTGMALRMAMEKEIPIFNLCLEGWRGKLDAFMESRTSLNPRNTGGEGDSRDSVIADGLANA